jgi:hypothetical protein
MTVKTDCGESVGCGRGKGEVTSGWRGSKYGFIYMIMYIFVMTA